jgi:hypothetical protein
MIQALLLSTLLFASPSPTTSPGRVRAGAARLLQAQSEFGRGDFAAALRSLDAARAEGPDDSTLARVELLDGQIRSAQRDSAGTEAAFTRALQNDPEIRLDPDRVDPDLVRQLDVLRETLKGELVVTVDAPARVVVDGKPLGPAPARTPLPIGRHTVVARSTDNLKAVTQEVVVRPHVPTELALTLLPLPAPEGATGEGLKPFADVRVGLDPLQYAEGLAFEVGGGVETGYLRGSVSARVFPSFGLTPRGALVVPVSDAIQGYVALELPVLFLSTVALGLGGEAGAELLVGKWLSTYVELGGRHFFINPRDYEPNRLTLQAGFRLRVP